MTADQQISELSYKL